MADDDDRQKSASYSVGIDGDSVVLRIDCEDAVIRLGLPDGQARRLATLILAACDIIDGDDVDDMIARARS